MNRQESAEFQLPPNIEFAGALQAVLRSLPGRDFELDLQQEASLEGIGHAVATGNTTGYVEMATGTGKTTVEALLAEAAVNAGQRVLLLAPSVTAANQIIGTDSELPKGLAKFTDLHDRQVIRQHYGTRRATRTSPVVVSTYNGFLNDYQRNHDSLGHFDVVIADECHRSLGEKTAAAMTAAYPEAIKIGLSATPDYAVDRTSEEVYSKSLFEFSLADAIESGKTAPIRALVVESDTVLALSDNRAEFTEQEQAPLMNDVGRNAIIAGLAADFVKQGRQGIVACVAGGGNFHARSVAQLLARPEFGEIRAADIGAHLDRDEVARRLKAFEKGDVDVLTSTRAILESWDSGQASFCINAAPTTSPVKLKQLLGRILRPKEDGTEATFIDLIDGQTGLRKQQYTALHALGLEEMDFKRVLGRQPHDQGRNYILRIADLPEFSGDLLDRLSKVQGRTLSDIFKSKLPAVVDPLVGHWETVLSKEGLPAELPSHAVVPDRFTKLYDKEFARLFADNGVEPDHDEVLAGLGTKITREARRALEAYGIRQDIGSMTLAELFIDEDDHLVDSLARKLLSEQISAVFDTLTEREAGIIAMRFGFEMDLGEVSEAQGWMSEDSFDKWVDEQVLTDKPWTHRQIGAVYGVTLERIRQIESKTMSKLRHPSRAEVLESYADVSEKLSPYARAKADRRYANAEMFARLKEARETGLENLMEDDSLTFTDSATLMTLSHDELKAARVYNHKATRHMCRLFGLRRQPQGEGIDYEIKFRKDALNQQMIGRQLVSSNVELEPGVRSQYWQEMQFYYHALQVLKRFETEIDRNSSVRSFITS